MYENSKPSAVVSSIITCVVTRILIPNEIPTHLSDFNKILTIWMLNSLGKPKLKEALDASVGPEEMAISKLTVPKIDPERPHHGNALLLDLDITEPIWFKECPGITVISVVVVPQLLISIERLIKLIYQLHWINQDRPLPLPLLMRLMLFPEIWIKLGKLM